MATTEKTWFTKTIARETVESKTTELLNAGEITSETKLALDNLFAGRSVTSYPLVKDDEGNILMKRCSYFEGYLPIEAFGTVGKDDNGETKYAHISKLGAKCQRDAKSTLETAIAEADAQLEVDEDVAAWKQAKVDAVEASKGKCDFEDTESDFTLIATYEDAVESVA